VTFGEYFSKRSSCVDVGTVVQPINGNVNNQTDTLRNSDTFYVPFDFFTCAIIGP
jgi:hypothetical protein